MSVQIWEKMQEDVGDLDELMERGEFGPLREWLGENIHRHGRKYPPQELLEKAIGSRIDAQALHRLSQAQVRRRDPRLDWSRGPVAQRTERQPSKLRAVVRFHPGPCRPARRANGIDAGCERCPPADADAFSDEFCGARQSE